MQRRQGTQFDLWSRIYDWPAVQRATYRPVHDAIVKALPHGSGLQVLDVGCGTGLLVTRVALQVSTAHVVGCDYSGGMLEHAARRTGAGGAVEWVRGDAMQLPLRSGSFDVLLCSESFHWYSDQRAALGEFVRVVARGGYVLMTLSRPLLAGRTNARTLGAGRHRINWLSVDEFRTLAAAVGLQVVSSRRIIRLPGLLLLPTFLVVCRRE